MGYWFEKLSKMQTQFFFETQMNNKHSLMHKLTYSRNIIYPMTTCKHKKKKYESTKVPVNIRQIFPRDSPIIQIWKTKRVS